MNQKSKKLLKVGMLSGLLMSGLVACDSGEEANQNTDSSVKSEQQVKEKELGVKKESGGFKIIPIEIEEYTERDVAEVKAPEHVTKIDMKIVNTSSSEKGIGSLDFKAFDKEGNEILPYGYAESIGDMVGIGEPLLGSLYFIGETKDIQKIVYTNPSNEEEITWNL